MKVFLTVATGTTGQWVARYLSDEKIDAYCGVRDSESEFARALDAKLNIHLVTIDYEDKDSLIKALKDMDVVIFISPLVEAHQQISDLWINAIKSSPHIKHIVRLSVFNAGDPKQLIEEWHAVTEIVLKSLAPSYTVVRPCLMSQNIGNFYGPTIKQTKKLYLPAGDGQVAFVDARDIAKILIHVACNYEGYKEQILEVNGETSVSMDDVAKIISEVMESKIEYVDLPSDKARAGLLQAGVPEILANISVETNELISSNHYNCPNDSVKKILGSAALSFKNYVSAYRVQF